MFDDINDPLPIVYGNKHPLWIFKPCALKIPSEEASGYRNSTTANDSKARLRRTDYHRKQKQQKLGQNFGKGVDKGYGKF